MNELEAFTKSRPTTPTLTAEERDRIWDQLVSSESLSERRDDDTLRPGAAGLPLDDDVVWISDDRRPERRRSSVVLVAAAVAALGVGGVLVVANRTPPADSTPQSAPADATTVPVPSPQPAIAVPGNVGTPGSVIPLVERPPAGFDTFVTAQRDSGFRTGYWTATAIARRSDRTYVDPIAVTAFDGTWAALDDASEITIDGTRYRQALWGTYTTLATTTTPTIAASGSVDPQLLADALAALVLDTSTRPYAAAFAALPDGYEQVSPFRELAADPTPRATLAHPDGMLVINEVSDWADPLLYAATTGADITTEDLAAGTGWSGTTASNPSGPLTFLVWAPQPGVVFEIVSTDPTRTITDLIALADATTTTSRATDAS